VADALMAGVIQRARRRGATSLWLGVWERNARAQAFYRRHGFGKVGRHTFVVGNDPQTDDVLLCPLT
jgi:ribosomal protein S18 acetylase RimI-like enzyme